MSDSALGDLTNITGVIRQYKNTEIKDNPKVSYISEGLMIISRNHTEAGGDKGKTENLMEEVEFELNVEGLVEFE